MKTYYHATRKKNTFKIIDEGLKAGWDGVVYLSDTVDGALEFMEIRQQPGLFAVIPVYLDESTVEESHDHNRAFIKANGYIHVGDIPAEYVEQDLNKIPLVELKAKKKKPVSTLRTFLKNMLKRS